MENENAVDILMDNITVDDGPQADTISAEDIAANLNQEEETVDENTGDGGQPQEKESSKIDNRIRAALRSQRETIFTKELGMNEQEVRELIRSHKAAEMAKADPDISVKAANEILKAREQGGRQDRQQEFTEAIATLRDDGWDDEELTALVSDKRVLSDLQSGKTLRQAARAYEKRQSATTERKRAVPTVRGSAAGTGGDSTAEIIANMSDADFKKFRQNIERQRMQGRMISF